MKAVVKQEPGEGHVGLQDIDEPACHDGQVKIAVRYCGICGTDLHVLHDTFPNYPPVVLGHEFAGTITEVGSNGAGSNGTDGLEVGERVAVLPSSAVTCGECTYCQQGEYMFCPDRRGMGHGVDGAMAPYAVVRPDQVYPVPEDLPLEIAALSEPFASAVRAVTEVGRPQGGEVALVSGPGPIGLMCLKLLVASGADTIVAGLSADERRLDAARQMGTGRVVDVEAEDLADVVAEETQDAGVDLAYEVAGAPASMRSCLEALRPLGRYVQVGIAGRPVELDFDTILHKQLQVLGSVGHSLQTWERVMRMLRRGAVELEDLITHQFPLDQWREGFDVCERQQGLKVLMTPSKAH
jgi:L-iditol 2-dehydrogenase